MIESSELMGIGLAYSQKMLKRMNSKLELSSVIDVGSTFSFRIKTEFVPKDIQSSTLNF